jgi:predicted nuclease with RNAse H fold
LILPNRSASVDRKRRALSRALSIPQLVLSGIRSLVKKGDMRLSMVFTDEEVDKVFRDASERNTRQRLFTPGQTLALFVMQTLSRDEACTTTVDRFNLERKRQRLPPVAKDASAYCKARSQLPTSVIESLSQRISSIAGAKALDSWKWRNRNVYLVDGMVMRAPDTLANQAKYPQPTSQDVGLGFPQVRATLVTSLATGCIEAFKTGPVAGKKSGEIALFRDISARFQPGDIVVGDRLFESYRDVALLQMRGVDVVLGMNGTRKSPFAGECISIEESFRTITRPDMNSKRFTIEQWNALPASITYRMIRYRTKGRKDCVTIVTSLLDPILFPAEAVAELYGLRWDIELDIRCFKTTMRRLELRCLTPKNVDREIAVSVLAHNLVRLLTNDAAQIVELHPREISFSQSRDAWMTYGREIETVRDLMWAIHSACARFVRDRPNREEPREKKSRDRNKYKLLKQPRPSRARMLAKNGAPELNSA